MQHRPCLPCLRLTIFPKVISAWTAQSERRPSFCSSFLTSSSLMPGVAATFPHPSVWYSKFPVLLFTLTILAWLFDQWATLASMVTILPHLLYGQRAAIPSIQSELFKSVSASFLPTQLPKPPLLRRSRWIGIPRRDARPAMAPSAAHILLRIGPASTTMHPYYPLSDRLRASRRVPPSLPLLALWRVCSRPRQRPATSESSPSGPSRPHRLSTTFPDHVPALETCAVLGDRTLAAATDLLLETTEDFYRLIATVHPRYYPCTGQKTKAVDLSRQRSRLLTTITPQDHTR